MKRLIKLFSISSSVLIFIFVLMNFKARADGDEVFCLSIDSQGNERVVMKSEIPRRNRRTHSINYYIPEGLGVDYAYLLGNSSNGGDISDAIVGGNDRDPITISQYSVFPYSTICHVHTSFPNGTTIDGTGFLVGTRTVLTACHVVYDCSPFHNYGWGSISLGFGEHDDGNGNPVYSYANVLNFETIDVGNFRATGDSGDDWAVLQLGIDAGEDLGYLGIVSVLNTHETVKCIGYSYDYGNWISYGSGQTTYVETKKFNHNCDLTSGASGGPITYSFFSVGIQSMEVCYANSDYGIENIACKIQDDIIDWVDALDGNNGDDD